jgi:hypothetical protein
LTGRRQGRQDRQRIDEALIEHAEDGCRPPQARPRSAPVRLTANKTLEVIDVQAGKGAGSRWPTERRTAFETKPT